MKKNKLDEPIPAFSDASLSSERIVHFRRISQREAALVETTIENGKVISQVYVERSNLPMIILGKLIQKIRDIRL